VKKKTCPECKGKLDYSVWKKIFGGVRCPHCESRLITKYSYRVISSAIAFIVLFSSNTKHSGPFYKNIYLYIILAALAILEYFAPLEKSWVEKDKK